MKKKWISMIMVVTMILSMVSTAVWADELSAVPEDQSFAAQDNMDDTALDEVAESLHVEDEMIADTDTVESEAIQVIETESEPESEKELESETESQEETEEEEIDVYLDEYMDIHSFEKATGTYDVIWFGSYPQAMVVDTDGTMQSHIEPAYLDNSSGLLPDYIKDPVLYKKLQNASWDAQNDVWIDGCRYHRVNCASASSYVVGSTRHSHFVYKNVEEYVYFKYQPILWRVLSIDKDGNALLMADKCLDDQRFMNSYNNYLALYWRETTIRTWLNSTFFNRAFNQSQQGAIRLTVVKPAINPVYPKIVDTESTSDYVYMLDGSDYINANYGFSTETYDTAKQCKGTTYAKAMGLVWGTNRPTEVEPNFNYVPYLTRSTGRDLASVAFIKSSGYLNCDSGDHTNSDDLGVRPCIRIYLGWKDRYKKAGQVTLSGNRNIFCYHEYTETYTPATLETHGMRVQLCKICGSKVETRIYHPSSIYIPEVDYKGTGVRPSVQVYDYDGKAIDRKYYDVEYENNVNPGTGKAIITFSGYYSGTTTREFTIIPPVVEDVKAVPAGKKKVKLTWTAAPNVDGYIITAQKDGKYGVVGSSVGTSYTDSNALDSDYNFYFVFSYVKDAHGKNIVSPPCKYVFAKGVTAAVTNLKAASQTGGVKLTWTASEGADGYLIYGIRGSDPYGYVGMTTKGTTYTDTKASKTDWNFYYVFPFHYDDSHTMIIGGTAKYVYGKAR